MPRVLTLWLVVLLAVLPGCGRTDSDTAAAEVATPPATSHGVHGVNPMAPATTRSAGRGGVGAPASDPTTRSAAEGSADRLFGTWVAHDVDTKLGEVKIRLTFKEEGPVKIVAWSDLPIVGQVRNTTAPYTVRNNVIHSDAIRGGTSVEYWFDGDNLMIRYSDGKTVRFTRQ